MNILILGSGGREHAIAWSLAQSPSKPKLFALPGNPGIAELAELADIDLADHRAIVDYCRKASIELVIVGPEQPLVEGLADNLRAVGLATFGPGKVAAQIEGSKSWARTVAARAKVPMPRHTTVTKMDAAQVALSEFDLPVVVKADGLAAGKGVTIAETREEAEDAIAALFDGRFGAAGKTVLIEECLEGEEVSVFALTDGTTVHPFGHAQDHKRLGEGDTGPNTGGMGAYSPAPVLDEATHAQVMDTIIRPVLTKMAREGTPYEGVLYAGVMLTADGPKLIEFNCRFGDPETQVLLPRLQDDFVELVLATVEGRLAERAAPAFSDETALTVVMAAKGYPDEPESGAAITGLGDVDGALVFQAGTSGTADKLTVSGGRVLAVTGLGATLAAAKRVAEAGVDAIAFKGAQHRGDIGWRELERGAETVG